MSELVGGNSGCRAVYLQDAYGLEASEGSLSDVADGVVAQTEGVEIPQHSQAAFVQARQVVVRQIAGERNGARDRVKRTETDAETGRERNRKRKKGGQEREMYCVRSGRR